MIQRVPLSWSALDVYERVLDHGVTLPARDRLAPITTEGDPSQEHRVIAVVSVETYSEVHPLSS